VQQINSFSLKATLGVSTLDSLDQKTQARSLWIREITIDQLECIMTFSLTALFDGNNISAEEQKIITGISSGFRKDLERY